MMLCCYLLALIDLSQAHQLRSDPMEIALDAKVDPWDGRRRRQAPGSTVMHAI